MDYHNSQIAEIYDLINPWSEDYAFYLSLAGTQSINVLDLGCGTGTLCCALAEGGHRVTGVDPAAAMLNLARSKPHAQRVEWIESAAQSYRSDRRFDLILMTGHAFQALLTDADILAVLDAMRRHLARGGRVAFETRNPRVDWGSEWKARQPRRYVLPGRGEFLETLEVTSHTGEFISFQTSYRFEPRPPLATRFVFADSTLTTTNTLRFPSRGHLEALISRSKLVVRSVFGDWSSCPFDPARSREIIFVAENAE